MRGGRFLQGYDRRGTGAAGRDQPRRARLAGVPELPAGIGGEWNRYPSDVSLENLQGGFRAYFAAPAGWSGADSVTRPIAAGAGASRAILVRAPGWWDGLDLGEPSTFEAFGRRYMLYGGLRFSGEPRQIGLAVLVDGRWRRCGDSR